MTSSGMLAGDALIALIVALHLGVLATVAVNVWTFRRQKPRAEATPVRVSVLVPARNEEANLARLVPSVLAQTGVEVELIVVDDASEDGTWGVLEGFADDSRLVPVRGSGPPEGWVGKTYALHTAAAHATGSVFVFLDADAVLRDPRALSRLIGRWQEAGGSGTALTGMPHYLDRGAGALLTSLVPFAIVSALPVALVPRTANPALSALNGQNWILGADDYRRLAPHAAHADEVLEDVMIGRYLKRSGIRLWLVDTQGELAVRMYGSFGEAWHGFRKNAYLLAGGTPLRLAAFLSFYSLCWVVPSVTWLLGPVGLVPLATLVVAKAAIDRWGGLPLWVSACAPVAVGLGAALMLDSAIAHARGRVAWKGRRVG